MTTDPVLSFLGRDEISGYRYISRSDVGVVNIASKIGTIDDTIENCLKSCMTDFVGIVKQTDRVLANQKALFYVRTPSSRQQNVIAKKKRLWGVEQFNWIRSESLRTKDAEFTDDRGSYFAGIAALSESEYFDALNCARKNSSCFVLFSNSIELTDETVKLFSTMIDKKSGSAKWSEIIDKFVNDSSFIVKVHGNFDDREISIDLVMNNSLFRKLEQTPAVGPAPSWRVT